MSDAIQLSEFNYPKIQNEQYEWTIEPGRQWANTRRNKKGFHVNSQKSVTLSTRGQAGIQNPPGKAQGGVWKELRENK